MTLPNKSPHVFSQVCSTAAGTYQHQGQTHLPCSRSKGHENSEGCRRGKVDLRFSSPQSRRGDSVKPLLPIDTLVSLHLDCLRDFLGDYLSVAVARAYAHTGALLEASECCSPRQHNSCTRSGQCKLLFEISIDHLWGSRSRAFPNEPT